MNLKTKESKMLTKNEITSKLAARGVTGLCTRSYLAKALGITSGIVGRYDRMGKLKSVDMSTYSLDDIVNWLMEFPRYVADK